jgi:hypothetical protein
VIGMDDISGEPRLNLRPPPPVRFDREQLEVALRPVIQAVEELTKVIASMAPGLTVAAEQLARIARAVEATEDRAAMAPRRKR